MTTLYLTLILLISFVGGVAVTSYTLLSALICFTFALPLTKELNDAGVLSKGNTIAKRYRNSALFLIVAFVVISALVYWFGSSAVLIGYAAGFVLVVIKIVLNPNQIGVNKENVSDYIGLSSNRKYFVKVSPSDGTPADDVLNFISMKVFTDKLSKICSAITRRENLKSQTDANNRATEIFKDAYRIEPETEEGKRARKESQEYALQVTQLVRIPRQMPVTDEEKEALRNHPIFGFSEQKKRKYENERN